MLHLRVICPAEHTEGVLAGLQQHPGAAHVVLVRGGALEPAGDLIEVDLAREAADDVLAAIRASELTEVGAVTITDAGTTMSARAERAEAAAPGDADDAVVWDELIARTGEESRLTGTFLAFLCLACVLAAVGVVTDSPVTIVGAMVVGPEFGPLAAIAVGLVARRWLLVRRAALALAVGFPVAMLVTAAAALGGEWSGLISSTSLPADSEVSFVYQVGWSSLIVSLLAGAAGMLSLTSAKSAVLVGVFISVTTVPAAGYAVVAATLGDWVQCASSIAQLAVNLVGIVVSATVVLLLRAKRARPGEGIPTREML
ncbi:uncharacterized hydrophobic domain-containing protein [Saccharopolyspora antimicrobica]|uniref:Hydrophobic protein (TIGR00271 family) n=1 Tax=Saccharopolyspora antimicrobica TaxID=455193 RepID=A0A1I5BDH5_9PSEU|nr:DUF389 domain-containing protein [Saccharopolyspora antimicrobica]RKT86569.1 putative hydrophobic protein (TIGR00271 family) [Saccharopolyspora antimicrobica]SFN72752.1 uncharacterized hydrophobic domain-containing protein [Saccharopolyspora antimicrobica]